MEHRNGLVVDVTVTHATGMAELEAAQAMVKRTINKLGAMLGVDKNYDTQGFVTAMRKRKVTPHVASRDQGSAIDDRRTTRHDGYRKSLEVRKRIEEIFGWANTVGPLCQTKFRGLKKVAAQTIFTFAASKNGFEAEGIRENFNSLLKGIGKRLAINRQVFYALYRSLQQILAESNACELFAMR